MIKYKICKALFAIVTLWNVQLAVSNNNIVCQGSFCNCSQILATRLTSALCSIHDWRELKAEILQPQKVGSLELTNHGDSNVPDGIFTNYTRMTQLTLIVNQLQSLILSRLADHLPSSLSTIELRGYRSWIPDDSLLQMQNLQVIRGAYLSNSCEKCTLQRNYTYKEPINERINPNDFSYSSGDLSKGEFYYGVHSYCRGQMYKLIGNITRLVSGFGFFPRCIAEQEKCFTSQIVSTPIHRCYKTDNDILNIALVIGPVAMVLNLLTVGVILSTKTLRKTTCMLLVSNMAICNILNTFYTVSVVIARKFTYIHFLTFMGPFCNFFGFVWSSGQFSLITTSLLLTIERYLVIVFAVIPERKLKRGHALFCIAVLWALAIISCSLPLAGIGTYVGNTYCIPFKPVRDPYHSYELTIAISIMGTTLYLITLALYVRIFVFVKKASQASENGREQALAQRIALLVFSNMIFYFTPIFIGLLWVTTSMAKHMTPVTKEVLTGSLPVLLFGFNSLLNPILYAFRNDEFMRELKSRLLRLSSNPEGIVPLKSTSDNSENPVTRPSVDPSVSFSNRSPSRFELQEMNKT